MKMRIASSAFKAQCLRLIDEVAEGRSEVIITKHGKPKARLVPFDDEPRPLFGYLRGSVTVRGDITAPLDETWDATDEVSRK